MKFLFTNSILLMLALLCFSATAWAQADASGSGRTTDREELPKNVKEMLFKMQVDQAKKDHQELLDKAEELLAITDQLEKTVELKGDLTGPDFEKLASAEKLAKKIRGELGAEGDSEDDPDMDEPKAKPTGRADGIKFLHDQTGELVDELRKTTRFTISVVAIQSANAVLRAVRFLRSGS
jgi:hypothetical protein